MAKTVKRRPFLGFFGGGFLGLGLILVLVVYGIIALNVFYILLVPFVCALLGLGLAYIAPVRRPA